MVSLLHVQNLSFQIVWTWTFHLVLFWAHWWHYTNKYFDIFGGRGSKKLSQMPQIVPDVGFDSSQKMSLLFSHLIKTWYYSHLYMIIWIVLPCFQMGLLNSPFEEIVLYRRSKLQLFQYLLFCTYYFSTYYFHLLLYYIMHSRSNHSNLQSLIKINWKCSEQMIFTAFCLHGCINLISLPL